MSGPSLNRALLQPQPYRDLVRSFEWNIPEFFNIGEAACGFWAKHDPDRLAIIDEQENGSVREWSFLALDRLANRFANALIASGARVGDRVGIHLPQRVETAAAHLGALKAGLVTIPLFELFAHDALTFRLRSAEARVLITNETGAAAVNRDELPALNTVVSIDGPSDHAVSWNDFVYPAKDQFAALQTRAEDRAMIIFTSGTEGPPKGAVHAHRVLLGHLPGVEMPQNFMPQAGDRFWTPADWSWIGGLLDVLLPGLYYGIPVVARRFAKFDPEAAFDLLARHRVRNTFLPPTALKLMAKAVDRPVHGVNLRSVGSGGERLGAPMQEWSRTVFGRPVNEFYGQTEVNLVISNCHEIMDIKPGFMGRTVPGHYVAVVDDEGVVLPAGEVGNIAVRRPDPVLFLEYFRQPEKTAEKFIGDWCILGDRGYRDREGYFWFEGRNDDVISSAGYRIGPAEIEECLQTHETVQMSGVIGREDTDRGEIIVAYVVLAPRTTASDALKVALQDHVRTKLAAHEYPREVIFIDVLPMTVTGKIQRAVLRQLDARRAR
mgnify:CR=1 FL=1